MMNKSRPQIVIIGAGFGGLFAARALGNKNADVLIIDRHNYHTFTPLIYQVATCGLDVEDVAYPVRKIFAEFRNVNFLLGDVTGIDSETKTVDVRAQGQLRQVSYDYLIVAAGSVTNYFGNDELAQRSFGLKDLEDAVTLRTHLLTLFEKADWATDQSLREAMTTLVVVGGGPTGLETAGALYELYTNVLQKEYPRLRDIPARVLLIEANDHLLHPYPESLRESALRQLQSLGVEVVLGKSVQNAAHDHIVLSDGTIIPTYTLVWSTGVKASPLAEMLNVPLSRGGRVPVTPTLEVIGRDGIYAIGDIAYLEDENGNPYPQLIPVAQQQAKLAARNILKREQGASQQVFRYFDKGTMATIGRSRAVVWLFNRLPMSGFIAWVAWLGLHLITLMGFKNRLSVFVNWVWNYLTYDRTARVIFEQPKQSREREARELAATTAD